MSQKGFRLKWRGKEVLNLSETKMVKIMGDIALTAEGESKKELAKGHGVKTGTLRRSIHAASPDYDFAKDNTDPGPGTPELGGKQVRAKRVRNVLMVLLGSGLNYAMAIHQGWSEGKGLRGSFAGYHYLTNGAKKTEEKVGSIVERNQVSGK